jgi:hypothetical protein
LYYKFQVLWLRVLFMKVGKIPNLAICGHRPCTDCCEKITKGFEVSRDEKRDLFAKLWSKVY